MLPVYSRARILLATSLWWESGSRVLAEAMLNAIPAIVTDNGGNAEMIGEGGITIALPARYHEKPYAERFTPELLDQFVRHIVQLYDNEPLYHDYTGRSGAAGAKLHKMDNSVRKLIDALDGLITWNTGNYCGYRVW